MILTYHEFKKKFIESDDLIGITYLCYNFDSIFECYFVSGFEPYKFVNFNDEYIEWCKLNLKGRVEPAHIDDEYIEWYAFEHKDDIMLWTLKWL